MLTRRLLAAPVLASLVIVGPTVVEAAPIISAPFVTVGVGETFVIPISITGVDTRLFPDLTSWQFDLAFDPTIVQANAVTEGPFMSAFGATLFVPGVIDNFTGLISLTANFYVDVPPNPTGDGVLADIEFLALSPGVSPLTFSNVFLNLSDQGFDIENGQITVTGTPIPEPAAVALVTGGLALLSVRARFTRRGREREPRGSPRFTGTEEGR